MRQRVALALAWRPEWPVSLLVGAGWLTLGWLQISNSHAAHASHAGATPGVAALGAWALMTLAMMVPATLPAVRHVGLNSTRDRRRHAMGVYVAAYVAVWIVFGAAALAAAIATTQSIGAQRLVVVTLALGAAWQISRTKRRAVAACRRTVPLPPGGWRADVACARFGVRQACRCVRVCWPLMFLMAVVGHQIVLMMALTVLVLAEERAPRPERFILPIAGVLASAAVWMATVA